MLHRLLVNIPLMLVGSASVLIALVLVVLVVPRVLNEPVNIQLGGEKATATAIETNAASLPISMGERIVNLADPGGYRYLKVEIVLNVRVPGLETDDLTDYKLAETQTEVSKELAPVQPEIQDAITSVLSSRTVADVSMTDGKEQLKQELIARLQPVLGDKEIDNVYFTQFIIQ